MDIRLLIQLFFTFLKIGAIAFGGGYTVIPLLQREAVEHRKWMTDEELTDIMAISQTLPGVITVNSSTMIGYKVCGFWGALAATTASILPTFVIILLVSIFFWNYTDNPIVKKAFSGILLGVTALIMVSVTQTWKSVVNNYFDIILVVTSSALLILFKVNVILVLLGVAAAGFTRNLIAYKKEADKR
jgi:chromate transporter